MSLVQILITGLVLFLFLLIGPENWAQLSSILLLGSLGLATYLLPTCLAEVGKHKNSKAIFALNLFLGWTLIGWVVALVWALTKEIG